MALNPSSAVCASALLAVPDSTGNCQDQLPGSLLRDAGPEFSDCLRHVDIQLPAEHEQKGWRYSTPEHDAALVISRTETPLQHDVLDVLENGTT